jgi:hypothetical protein
LNKFFLKYKVVYFNKIIHCYLYHLQGICPRSMVISETSYLEAWVLVTQPWYLVSHCFLRYKHIWLWNIKNSILYKIIQNLGIKRFLKNYFSSGICSWASRASVSTSRTYALLRFEVLVTVWRCHLWSSKL